MQEALINNELELAYPNRFHVMQPEELKQAFGVDYSNMWGIRDEERHVIFAMIWKEANELLLKMMSVKSHAKQNEKQVRKSLGKHGYHCEEFFEREIAGQEARGFRFSFVQDGVGQVGEVTIFRHGKCSYSLYYYTSQDKARSNRSTYDKILDSFSLS